MRNYALMTTTELADLPITRRIFDELTYLANEEGSTNRTRLLAIRDVLFTYGKRARDAKVDYYCCEACCANAPEDHHSKMYREKDLTPEFYRLVEELETEFRLLSEERKKRREIFATPLQNQD